MGPTQKQLAILLAGLLLLACSCSAPGRRFTNICDDCAADNFARYQACWEKPGGCSWCDNNCCSSDPGKRDRCCCLHADICKCEGPFPKPDLTR